MTKANTRPNPSEAAAGIPGAVYKAVRDVLEQFGPQTTREVFKVLQAIGEVNLKPTVPVLNYDAFGMAIVRDHLHIMRKHGLVASRKSKDGLIWTIKGVE